MSPVLLPVLGSLIEKLIPDAAARDAARLRLLELSESGELKQLDAAVSVIVAESAGNFLQRSWRPILMLTFGALIVARWLGYAAPNLSEVEIVELWAIVKIGIGGYTVGRSVEKVVPVIAGMMAKGGGNG